MQTLKKASEKSKKEKERTKDPQDEKHKSKTTHNVTTPRNYMQKSSTADIYGQKDKNAAQATRAPKKIASVSQKSSNASPMRDLLKSSSSSVSVASRVSDTRVRKIDAKVTPRKSLKTETNVTPRIVTKVESKATPHTVRQTLRRDLPFSNVTVNSPATKKKLNLDIDPVSAYNVNKPRGEKYRESISQEQLNKTKSKEISQKQLELSFERQRTKTRTLDEDEVKILTQEVVDNKVGMMNLTRKLTAQPKAFFVGLEDEHTKNNNNVPSDEEVSYEDDFESYESDFESYHSESNDEISSNSVESCNQDECDDHDDTRHEDPIDSVQELRDEERMLDSGSYDLRDRSAKSKPSIMENIIEDEDTEERGNKKISLPDEGFQDMSSASAVSSLKTIHVDALERPLFIDFKKSKETKRKRIIFERLKKRAEDLLGMISLHEMTYCLFEIKPISYELFIATFGRKNYLQTGVQTFDDGVSEEVQCDEICRAHKWTQNPVKFSNSEVCLNSDTLDRKYSVVTVDYLAKFSFLTQQNDKQDKNNVLQMDESYNRNPLRIYLEQKDGVGSSEILPYKKYKEVLNNKKYDPYKLGRFLKKIESRVSNILSMNSGNINLDVVKSTNFPFSKGYASLNVKSISHEDYTFLKQSKITHIFLSDTKSNVIMTVHQNPIKKYLICVWDANVVRLEPIKVLIARDNIVVGRFRGSTDGVFVAALEDGTIHLWDLSEDPFSVPNTTDEVETAKLLDVKAEHLTQFENDRALNLINSNVKNEQQFNIQCALQPCAYTSSALAMCNGEVSDRIVGLEFASPKTVTLDGSRRIVGQVVSLQSTGVIVTWVIVQEKNKTNTDIGKAYWSKLKLEKSHAIDLNDHIEHNLAENQAKMESFSLNSVKKRLMIIKQERNILKIVRQKSAAIKDFGRSSRAASARSRIENKLLPLHNIYNSRFICNDLKIMTVDEVEHVLVAKNCGEVLCCKRYLGAFKVSRFYVSNEASSVTSLQVSSHGLPHFLAATDTGTVNLCSLSDKKVLHTLDCRNVPPVREISEKYRSDSKGRYVGSVSVNSGTLSMEKRAVSKMCVTSLVWSQVNPCCIHAVMMDGGVVAWDLAQSDIYGKMAGERVHMVAAGDCAMSILTDEEEVQIHSFKDDHRSGDNLELFRKYVALL